MSTQIQNSDEAFNALLNEWIGKLIKCEKENGKIFTARLVAIRGNHLLFQNKAGKILMDSMTSIKFMIPMLDKDEMELDQDVADHLAEEQAVFEEMEKGYYSTVDADAEAYARARKGL